MRLIIKSLHETPFFVNVEEEMTMLEVKKAISKINGIDQIDQKLIFKGNILDNSITVSSLKLRNNSALFLFTNKPNSKPNSSCSQSKSHQINNPNIFGSSNGKNETKLLGDEFASPKTNLINEDNFPGKDFNSMHENFSNPFTSSVNNPFTNPLNNPFTNPLNNPFTNPLNNSFNEGLNDGRKSNNPFSNNNPFNNSCSNNFNSSFNSSFSNPFSSHFGGLGGFDSQNNDIQNELHSPLMESLLKKMREKSPKFGHAINDDDTIAENYAAFRDPRLKLELFKTADRTMDMTEMRIGGFRDLVKHHQLVEATIDEAMNSYMATVRPSVNAKTVIPEKPSEPCCEPLNMDLRSDNGIVMTLLMTLPDGTKKEIVVDKSVESTMKFLQCIMAMSNIVRENKKTHSNSSSNTNKNAHSRTYNKMWGNPRKQMYDEYLYQNPNRKTMNDFGNDDSDNYDDSDDDGSSDSECAKPYFPFGKINSGFDSDLNNELNSSEGNEGCRNRSNMCGMRTYNQMKLIKNKKGRKTNQGPGLFNFALNSILRKKHDDDDEYNEEEEKEPVYKQTFYPPKRVPSTFVMSDDDESKTDEKPNEYHENENKKEPNHGEDYLKSDDEFDIGVD
ncbi:hypothetical protein TRFO_22209 [Tritrichomonas foetus]|uniref:Ubiquitin-like domain-containing protein n=1 Tax=Tritrichomonas foetus TaxID=1144522 RepID=A0A1J4KDI3_9EUKA|nr:hypothetical protein TRFO_22209 [Tritrichomonas foetus]|eukprot:OHT09042.1 hypothetical protein TRFO_22209 [Tritrichomonas foetus]